MVGKHARIIKRFFSLAIITVIVSTCSLGTIAANVSDGNIAVYTKQDLNNIRNNLSASYILMNDINFSAADFKSGGEFYNGGQGWKPIGYVEYYNDNTNSKDRYI